MKFHRFVPITESTPVPAVVYDLCDQLVGSYDRNTMKTYLSKLTMVKAVRDVWASVDSGKATFLMDSKQFVEFMAAQKGVEFRQS